MTPGAVLASLAAAVGVAALARLVLPPTPRLDGRLRPYVGIPSSISAGRSGILGPVFAPMAASLARALGRLIDRRSDELLAARLRQAGWGGLLTDPERVSSYRMAQLKTTVLWTTGAGVVSLVVPLHPRSATLLVIAATVVGATRERAALDGAITERRDRMRVEIYTVNQLLAMRIRSGGGVIQAIQRIVDRGSGAVVDELREALRLHRSGMSGSEAFRRLAAGTPEPACQRTYALLAIAEERGVDLAEALLALSEDVREARRETLRRLATRRRAAMLVPTIVILAPVMLLFVGAPLPRLVLGWQ